MPGPLPDIDLGSWADYQKSELQRQIEEKLSGFGLGRAIEERISGSQEVVGQTSFEPPPEPEPPPAPPPPPPQAEPEPVANYQPPPELAPEPEPAPVPSVQPRAAPVADSTPPPSQPPEVDPFSAWRQQAFAAGLNAIEAAGGNVQAFAGQMSQGLRGAADRGSATAAALNAAEAAGADVSTFMQSFRPPPMPEPPASAPPVPSGGRQAAQAPGGPVNPDPTPTEVRQYISQAAEARGIDPNIALRVANSEGGFEAARRGTFKTGSSWWPFQLHYGGQGYEQLGTTAGMGNQFTRETGYQPGDPNAWQAATDYALDRAKQAGWGAWYGAQKQGITGFQGIDRAARDVIGEGIQGARQAISGQNPYVFPVQGYQGKVDLHWGSNAGGADLFGERGTPIVAMRSGRVTQAGSNAVGGNTVTIMGDDGNEYYYAHLDAAPSVKAGQAVRTGDYLGPLGDSGNAKGTGTHLHLGIGPNIQSGTGPAGGTGGDFDATGLLRRTLSGQAEAPATRGFFDQIGQPISDAVSGAQRAADATQQRIEAGLSELEEGRARTSRDLQARIDELTRGERSITRPLYDAGLREPVGPVARQLRGEEDAQLGPITIPGRLAAPFGVLGELSGDPSETYPSGGPLKWAAGQGREEVGVGQLTRDFEARTGVPYAEFERLRGQEALAIAEGTQGDFSPETRQMVDAWNSLGGIAKASEAYARAPEEQRGLVETQADIATAIGGTALLPGNVARTPAGIARAVGSMAFDPTNIPATGFGELIEGGAGALGRVFRRADGTTARLVDEGRLAPDSPVETDILDDVDGELPVARFPELERNITGAVADGVNAALRRTVGAEELADAQRAIDEVQGTAALNPFPELQTPEGLARVRNQLRALADAGAEQRFWYDDSSREIMRAVQGNKEDGEKIAQLVAIYSNKTPVDKNMDYAMTAWTQFKRGEPIDAPTMGLNNKRADALLYGGQDWDGAKTNNFYRNLMKDIDHDKYIQMGLETGETGVTVDIWMMRALNSLRKAPSAGTKAGQYEFASREIAKIAAERGWSPEQAQAAIWVATKAGWENAVRKVPMDLSAEGTFHYGTAMEQKLARSNLAGAVGGSEDVYARELGLLGSDGRISLPKARASRGGKAVSGAAAFGAVDDTARRSMNAYVAAHGIEKQLPEVYWAREMVEAPANLSVANGMVVNAGRALDADELSTLQASLDSLMGPGAARAIASDTGAWVLNRSDSPNKAFHNATRRALKGLESVPEVQTAERRFDSEFFANDWSTQTNGEGYLDPIRFAGGGFAERVQEISGRAGRAGAERGAGAGRAGAGAAPAGAPRDYGAESLRAPELPAASVLERGSAPLRTAVGREAAMGGLAGGYESTQDEEGATPQGVALGVLGGSAFGAGRGALPRRAGVRALGQVARIAEEIDPGELRQSARDDFRTGRVDYDEYAARLRQADELEAGPAPAAEAAPPAPRPPAAQRAERAARRLEQQARDEYRAGRITEQEYHDQFADAELLRAAHRETPGAARAVDNTRAAESVEEAVEDAATKTTPPLDDEGRLNPRPSTAEQMLDVVGARAGTTPRGERIFQHAIPGFGAPGSEVMTEVTQEVARRLPNLAKLAPENSDIRDILIANAASISPEQIDMYKRGTIRWDELVNDLAGRFGMTKEQYLATSVGQAYNEAEMLALRATVVNEARKEADMMLEFGKKGVANLTDQEKLAGITQILDTGKLQAVGTGAASTLGRALNQQKIKVTQEMARTITGQIEQRQAAKAAREASAKAETAAKKATDLEKKIADKKAEVAAREAKRAEIKGETDMLRAERTAARQKATQLIKDWEEALKAARSDEALHRRAQEIADKRAAREAARAEKVHEHLMGRAREGLRELGTAKITDELLADYIKLHQNKDPLAIGKFLKGLGNPDWWSRTNIIRYAGMLSSTFTHGTQALSNAIQLGLVPATHMAAVGADIAAQRFRGGERTRYMGELPEMMRGISAGYKEGLAEAAEVMKSGINVRSMNQDLENITKTGKSGLRQMDFGFEKTGIGKVIGKRASYGVNIAAETPLRAMQASDLIFRGAARGMHTRQLAARKAIAEGATDVGARTREIMSNLEDHMDLVDQADTLSKRAVLQEETWVSALRSAPTPVRVGLSLAMPFIRTPYNIAAQGIGMTPAGFASAVAAARRGERGEAVDRVARATLGTAVMAGAFLLLGDEHLTAGYPEDEAERSTKPPGWRPWSFRVIKPDGEAVYVPIAFLGPIAIPMALAAVAAEAEAQGKPADKMALQAVGQVGRFMADQAMLQGFNNAINAVVQPERYGEQWLESIARQPVPYSGLQRQISQILDMPSRDPENMFESLLSANLPTMDRVAPRLDPLGREVRTGQSGIGGVISPVRYSTGRDEDILKTLAAADVNIPGPPKTYRNMALTRDEQREFQQLAGRNIQQNVAEVMSDPRNREYDKETRQRMLERVVEASRRQAFGEIVQRWSEPEIDRRLAEEKERTKPMPVPR